MKINLKDISENEITYKKRYKSEKLDLNLDDFINLKYIDANIKVKFENDNKLDVRVNYFYNGEFRCVRCLGKINLKIKDDIYLEYDISLEQEFLDITKDIRNEIILSFPYKPLCKNNCNGLCSVCGKNLNLDDCNCEREKLSNPFSKLTQ